jgi:transglutaminase/protease-like cytokinesis protein 3
MTTYTKKFNDDYFFANKPLFNFQHYPDNTAWQMGPGPKSTKDFFQMPLVKHQAYEFGLAGFVPQNGFIKSNISKPVPFNIKINSNAKVDIVALEIGTDKSKRIKTVDYSFNNGAINFSYKFDEADTYPVTILINNKPVLGYLIEIEE